MKPKNKFKVNYEYLYIRQDIQMLYEQSEIVVILSFILIVVIFIFVEYNNYVDSEYDYKKFDLVSTSEKEDIISFPQVLAEEV